MVRRVLGQGIGGARDPRRVNGRCPLRRLGSAAARLVLSTAARRASSQPGRHAQAAAAPPTDAGPRVGPVGAASATCRGRAPGAIERRAVSRPVAWSKCASRGGIGGSSGPDRSLRSALASPARRRGCSSGAIAGRRASPRAQAATHVIAGVCTIAHGLKFDRLTDATAHENLDGTADRYGGPTHHDAPGTREAP